jgi:hypothetical protein
VEETEEVRDGVAAGIFEDGARGGMPYSVVRSFEGRPEHLASVRNS